MPTPKPVRLVDPFIMLGGTGTPPTGGTDMQCFSNGIHLTGESDDDLATFCDPEGFAYSLTLDLKMSLGPDSLDEALTDLGGPGTVVPFEFAYTADPASTANPHWSGKVRIPAVPIVDAGINEPTSFSLEMAVIGDVVRDDGTVTMALGVQGHSHAQTDPNDQTSTLWATDTPTDLAAAKADATHGDGKGTAMTTGQYVILGDGSKAHYDGTAWATGVTP